MDAFQRALGDKESMLKTGLESARRKHRREEDAMQKEIAESQAKKSAVENGKSEAQIICVQFCAYRLHRLNLLSYFFIHRSQAH